MLTNLGYLTNAVPQRTTVALSEVEGTCLADPEDSINEAFADTDILTCHSSNLDPKIIDKAVDDILKGDSSPAMIYDSKMYEESDVETDKLLVQFVQTRTERDESGRLIMPLLWNDRSSALLSNNYELAKCVLKSNFKRFRHDHARLKQYDDVFAEQEKTGVIAKIEDLPNFLKENPTCSFLPHMGVFKPDRETTKCRVVFLSNLCEATSGNEKKISHNQAMHCGPNLNKSLSTSIIQLRFDRLVMAFDLRKAFLSIGLNPHDQVKLLFLWYRNVAKNDFTLVAYKHLRLAFGLRCSPTLLMLALHKILILDSESDNKDLKLLKQLIYDLMYMDNGCITANDANELSLGWDDVLSYDVCNEWRKICKQINHSPALEVDRFVGRRDGNFQLIAFTDASKFMFGTVIYIRDKESGKLNFLTAKNRILAEMLDTPAAEDFLSFVVPSPHTQFVLANSASESEKQVR
ncbi:hypothetical protein HAZT_HAZT004531 [Hyalella azteca]|uniref:Reverse transcriptase domain-containing protein n=1 Tax=Hyalella azteca TaxID=294128 RepID=A0A6A0GSQ0_HYAAZ|nr:hypothetical protein HAZT_HAZT004531 [Hyalella azteca]